MPFFIAAIPVVVLMGAFAFYEYHKKATAPSASLASQAATAASKSSLHLLSITPGGLMANLAALAVKNAGVVSPAASQAATIQAAAQSVLSQLPASFTNDPYSLNRQIAAAALQYLASNPTPANLASTIQTLAGNPSPEARAAGAQLQQQTTATTTSRYQTS